MHVTLVSDPQELDEDIATFEGARWVATSPPASATPSSGRGHRVAEYGLAALVLGGAAAVATKSGFGKALIKFVGIGVFSVVRSDRGALPQAGAWTVGLDPTHDADYTIWIVAALLYALDAAKLRPARSCSSRRVAAPRGRVQRESLHHRRARSGLRPAAAPDRGVFVAKWGSAWTSHVG